MIWLPLQTAAQIAVERILNALPEGLLIAFFAWSLLRVLRRQSSGTRFAVWFVALLTIALLNLAALPVLGAFGEGWTPMTARVSSQWTSATPAIIIPGRWALFIFVAWAVGASAAMLRLAAGLWRLRKLRMTCTPIVVADLDPAVQRTVEAIGASGPAASRSTTVATSECVRVPAAIGFWKRTIVLPAWALGELPPGDLNVILLHEFAHLRRSDDWTNLIQKIVRAFFFFHPAVWWIEGRLSVEREMACDDAVLAQTANPRGYATCLVSLLEKGLAHRLPQRRWSMAQSAVHRAREASLRLARILDTNRPQATRVWKPALGMVGAFSLICLAVLSHSPQFVAFDRGIVAGGADSASQYAARVGTDVVAHPSPPKPGSPSSPRRLVIHHGERSPLAAAANMTAANAFPARATAQREFPSAPPAAARLIVSPPREHAVLVGASANGDVVPEFRTLVFVEATEYVTSDSSIWSVQVWRVTLVSTVGDRITRVPEASSI